MQFLKTFEQKIAFFRRAPPSNLSYIGAKGAFRNVFMSLIQNWIFQNITKGALWVGRGSNPWGKEASPPLYPLLVSDIFAVSKKKQHQLKKVIITCDSFLFSFEFEVMPISTT